jgi:hypothetical protein
MSTLHPRLILSYLTTRAIIHQTPQIEVEASLTDFLRRMKLGSGQPQHPNHQKSTRLSRHRHQTRQHQLVKPIYLSMVNS